MLHCKLFFASLRACEQNFCKFHDSLSSGNTLFTLQNSLALSGEFASRIFFAKLGSFTISFPFKHALISLASFSFLSASLRAEFFAKFANFRIREFEFASAFDDTQLALFPCCSPVGEQRFSHFSRFLFNSNTHFTASFVCSLRACEQKFLQV